MSRNNSLTTHRTAVPESVLEDARDRILANPLETTRDFRRLVRDVVASAVAGETTPEAVEAMTPLLQTVAGQMAIESARKDGGAVVFEQSETVTQTIRESVVASRLTERRTRMAVAGMPEIAADEGAGAGDERNVIDAEEEAVLEER